MEPKPQPPANSPPPKPWERESSTIGPTLFRPPSAGNTSDVVEASGTANPGEIVSTSDRNTAAARNALGRPLPTRPWEQNYGATNYGGYGSSLNYNSGIGSAMYGSYGGYGGGSYGNSMYRGGYGGLYGSGMYGSGIYNGGFGGPMGGYGMGMGGPYGTQDPNNPYGPPSSPPGFWMSVLRVVGRVLLAIAFLCYLTCRKAGVSVKVKHAAKMHGVVSFFGRVSFLIDQNTQAFHLFMTALLQLFDRTGLLYGELARFVLRLLGIRSKHRKVQSSGANALALPGPNDINANQNLIEGPKVESWDNVWGK